MRKKNVLGLKNIDVYAFELKENKKLNEDLLKGDMCMTIRLQIVNGKLSICSVHRAFEESVGHRLQKFSGSDNKELLQRFTSQFKDEYEIPKGSGIDLSRDRGQILQTKNMRKALSWDVKKKSVIPLKWPVTPDELEYD